jgi:cytochrome b561
MTAANYSNFSPTRGYTPFAKTLHWLTVVLVLIQLPLGFLIARQYFGDYGYNLHKSLGPLILIITLIRLFYRMTHPAPPLPDDLPGIIKLGAHANHYGLYALLIVQPIVGYVATSAYPAPVPFFGLFNLPKIWPDNQPLAEQLYVVHYWLGIVMVIFIAGHVCAALFHYFVRKDTILQRMTTA